MPPAGPQHDPFTDAPLRPSASLAPSSHSLRGQATQHSLRSAASTANSRSRQQTNLFAPSLSRRPTSRATPSFEDDVLADETEEEELTTSQQLARQQRMRHGKIRHGSPESKHARLQKSKSEDVEFVKRRVDGGYQKDMVEIDAVLAEHMQTSDMESMVDERQTDTGYIDNARKYWTTAPSSGTRAIEKHEQEWEQYAVPASAWLRTRVLEKLDQERWRWEPVEGF